MKQHIKIFIGAAMVCLPLTAVSAQTDKDTLKTDKVPVAFKEVAKGDILGGVQVLDYRALTQKNYNTYSLDNMQGYVSGYNGNSPWASGDCLVLVDGVPRNADTVLPTEIDKVTFLNSAASVALYGSRAAKGVILITTKEGQEGALRINGRANYGIGVAKSYPKYLSSAEYMSLYNEARANDGLSALYSDDDIYNYSSGSNPYRYPDVNFYSSDYIRKYYMTGNGNIDITGGGKMARFFANINYSRTGDVFKFGEAKHNYSDRLAFRGNINLQVNDWITAFVHTNVSFYTSRGANSSYGSYWYAASTLRPNRVSPLIPISYIEQNDPTSLTLVNNSQNIIDGKYFLGGTQIDQGNIFADYYAAGKNKYTSRQFQFDTGFNMDLDRFVKGLSFQTQFAVDYNTSYTTSYNNSYAVFAPTWADYNGQDVIASLTKYNVDKSSGVQNISGSYNKQTILYSAQFNYKTTIDDVHNISAMVIGNGYQQTYAGEYHRTSNVNLGFEAAYNYANRYYLQFDAAEVHSAKLASGHRNAFSPSLTLGWKMKNESWLKNSDIVDDLTLSASLSELNTDLDISSYYLYEANYNQSDGAWWGWKDGVAAHSTQSKRGVNTDLTFIKRKEFSATLQASLLDHLLEMNGSFFVNVMDGGLISGSTLYPDYFSLGYPVSSFVPYVNYNKDLRRGFDFGVKANKKFGDVDLSLGVTGTYYTTRATKRDENYAYSYLNRQGRPLDAIFGLKSDGFYKDEADIASSPKSQFGDVKPGDIKYIDQNGDGKIDSNDEVYLGKGGWYGSPFTLGINFTAKWRGFTLFALGTGGYGAKALKSSTYYWVYGDRKYSEIVRNRWTPATAETATYPRLTTETSDNNFRSSDFWLYSTDRFDLSKVQLTYDFPKSMFHNSFVRGLQVYANGCDLLTLSGERKTLEMNVASSPQYRTYNVGVYVNF